MNLATPTQSDQFREGQSLIEEQTSTGSWTPKPKPLRSTVISDRESLVLGRRAFERGEDAFALESLMRLASHGNEYADVHYMIGMLEERQGNLDAALDSLRRATRINPAYVEALLALVSLHERRGEFDLSESYADRASQLARSSAGGLDITTCGKLANLQAALADALAEAGEKKDAIEEYRRALDRCPKFHDIRHRLGMTLREAGLPFQAAQEFRRILQDRPPMLESQIQLGVTYYSLGRTPEAIREWEAVRERDPNREEALMYVRLVGGGDRTPESAASQREATAVAHPAPSSSSHDPASIR